MSIRRHFVKNGHISIAQNNSLGFLYLIGNNDTDGSIRFIVSENGSSIHLERRTNGTWNEVLFRLTNHLMYGNSLDNIVDNSFHQVYSNQL